MAPLCTTTMISVTEKKTVSADLHRPLRLYTASSCSKREAEAADAKLGAVHDLRASLSDDLGLPSPSSLQQRLNLLLAYARALVAAEAYFPPSPGQAGIKLTWYDSFDSKRMATGSVHLEKCAVLFNIGAVYSQIALAANSTREACCAFESAAGAFKWLADSGLASKAVAEGATTADVTVECTAMISQLMLAQAQECCFHSVVSSEKSSKVCSEVAMQVHMFYKEVHNFLSAPPLHQELDKLLGSHIVLKRNLFNAAACYWFSLSLHEEEEIGTEITYLNIAVTVLADVKETSGSASFLNKLENNVTSSLQRALHQNCRTYKMKVPDVHSVNALTSFCAVKPRMTDFKTILSSIADQGSITDGHNVAKREPPKCKGIRKIAKENIVVKKKVLIPGCRRLCKQVRNSVNLNPGKARAESPFEWQEHNDCFILQPKGKQNTIALKIHANVYRDHLAHYQRDGVMWLWGIHCEGKGGILADDMGLGKTRQVSAFLMGLFLSNIIKRVLILAPTSVLKGWTKDLGKVEINVPVKQFCTGDPFRMANLEQVIEEGGVLLTTYAMFRLHYDALSGDVEEAQNARWDYIIMDEGHIIKNPTSNISKRVSQIICPHKIIVTGTPVQNTMEELHALTMVCCPTLLGDKKLFDQQYWKPISKAKYKETPDQNRLKSQKAFDELGKLTAPYILRRTKQNTLQVGDIGCLKLPKKTELTIWLKLSSYQEEMYKTLLTSKSLQKSLERAPLVTMTILKKLCNHPMLLKSKIPDEDLSIQQMGLAKLVSKKLADMIYAAGSEMDLHDSCKIIFLKSLLENILAGEYHVLIFSQSKQMLDIIEGAVSLWFPGQRILRIDGDVKRTARESIIADFENTKEDPAYIFLLTTQVGGFGITLTRASRVILVDPSWNPSTDNQAVDRAYRLGQLENVIVYRLMTCATVEEKAYKLQIIKGTDTTVFTEKRDVVRYFCEENAHEILSVPKSFDVSSTQSELEKVHGSQLFGDDEEDLKDHARFLENLDSVVSLTNHSLLFSKEAEKLIGVIEDQERQEYRVTTRRYHQKASRDDVVDGAKYALEPTDAKFKEPVRCIIAVVNEESRTRRLRIDFLKDEIANLEDHLATFEGMLSHNERHLAKQLREYNSELAALLEKEFPGSGSSSCKK